MKSVHSFLPGTLFFLLAASLFCLLAAVLMAGAGGLLLLAGDWAAVVFGWIAAAFGFLFLTTFLLLVFLHVGGTIFRLLPALEETSESAETEQSLHESASEDVR